MEINWDRAKEQTLWTYEALIDKLFGVLAYGFVRQLYNHSMPQAQSFAGQVQQGYLQGKADTAFTDPIITAFKILEAAQIDSYLHLVWRVATREKCAVFLQRTELGFEALIQTLNYLFRWVLPFRIPVRELIDPGCEQQMAFLPILKQHKLRSNLDLLEQGRSTAGRAALARHTRIPRSVLLDLVHRADISRLAFVRGKTVQHLCSGGFDRLEKIAGADLSEMEIAMDAYFQTIGKRLADFKSVVPLGWMVGGAGILPPVVEA